MNIIRTIYYFVLLLSAVSATQEQLDAALIKAVNEGNLDGVKAALKAKANVDKADSDGDTVLMRAAGLDHQEIVLELLEAGANPHLMNKDHETAFVNASPAVQHLLKNLELIRAADEGELERVNALLTEHGADVTAVDTNGRTPLMHAAWEGHADTVAFLLNREENTVDAIDHDGNTALMLAAEFGNLKAVVVLLAWKANVNIKNTAGRSALDLARENGHTEVVELLEYAMNAKLIHLIRKKSTLEEVRELLEAGANVNRPDKNGKTPLIWAATCNVEVIQELLDAGAEVNVRDLSGNTALDYHLKFTKETMITKGLENYGAKTSADLETAEAEANAVTRRRLAFGELSVSTLVLGIAVSLLLLSYLVYQLKRRLTTKRQPADTDLTTDLESGLSA